MAIRSLFFLVALTVFVFSAVSTCFADDDLDHFKMGNKYAERGQNKLAIEEFRKAIKIRPRIADYHYNLANALFVTDKVKEAIIEYKKAISINPLDSDFHRNLGISYIEAGETSKAREVLKDLKRMSPAKAKQLESFLAEVKKK